MPTNTNVKFGADSCRLVQLEEVSTAVFEMISDLLSSEGSCAFSIEKAWSEHDKMYIIQTFVHGEMPNFNEAKSQLEHAQMHVERELCELYATGFGVLSVEVSKTKGQKRAINITSGRTERFVIPIDEGRSA